MLEPMAEHAPHVPDRVLIGRSAKRYPTRLLHIPTPTIRVSPERPTITIGASR